MARSAQYRHRSNGIDMWMTVAAIAVAILMIVLATQVRVQP
jgi:hypothetical protein